MAVASICMNNYNLDFVMYLSIVIGTVSDIPGISNSTLAGDEERSVLHQSDRLCC